MVRARAQGYEDSNSQASPKLRYTPEALRPRELTTALAKVHHIMFESQKRRHNMDKSVEGNTEDPEAKKHHAVKRANTGHISYGDGKHLL